MRKAVLVARRELHGYFRSPLFAIVAAGSLLIIGIYFYWQGLSQKAVSADVLFQFFYGASGLVMIASIILSMRLFAEERQTGTMTLLNTAPITDREIVAGKFVSALLMIVLMIALTAYMPALIFVNGKVSGAHILVGYLGLVLLGAASVAVGLFASSLAKSQVVAAIIGAAIMAVFVTLWMLARQVDPPLDEVLGALALHHENQRAFMIGILELKNVVYYIAVTFFFLLAATKVLEARRWR